MSIDHRVGDTGRPGTSTESEAATGEDPGATVGALAGGRTAKSSPNPAPDGTERRGRGVRRRRRRHSFDGGALDGILRRSGSHPGGGGRGSGSESGRRCFAAAAAQQRERSASCASFSASGSALIPALATARRRGDGDDEAGGGGAATTSASNASPSRRQKWTKSFARKEAPTGGDGAAAAATGESGGGGSTPAASLPGTTGASGNAGEAAADDASRTTRTGGGNKRQLPLPLEPLAGRCWFEGCGKISFFRCRRCRLAFYCGRDHQRGDWPRHRMSCEEGRGEPPPPLARLALPLQRQKSVGWADSTTPRSTDGGGVGGRDTGGSASAAFRKNKSRLEAAMASAHSTASAVRNTGGNSRSFDPDQVRTARGGASWTVPTSSNVSGGVGAGSAAVWPASSSSVAGGPGGRGGGTGTRQRGGLAPQIPPSGSPPPPPGPPPPAKIPPPASRPLLDKLPKATAADAAADTAAAGPEHESSAEVDMLTEMGFERARAVQALQTCGGSVERAAEWLLTGFGGGDGDGIPHGPHLPGAGGGGGQDGDGGGRSWLGGGTEMGAVRKSGSAAGSGGGGGDNNDDDDDLITTADASDVGQGLDMRDFWTTERAGDGGGGGVDGTWGTGGREDAGAFGKPGWGTGAGGGNMAAVEEDDDEDLVTCYEDTVGGVQADVVIFFRPADAAAGAAAAPTAPGEGDGEEAGWGAAGAGGGQGEGAVLTLVVRPLPSTAPASVDSGSSRGGTDYDRHDIGHDIEHALTLPWPQAENLARRHETAQALRAASSTAVAAAAAAVGMESHELAGDADGGGAADAWRQGQGDGGGGRIFDGDLPPPLSPSSPLRPTSRSYDDGAGGSPSWGRKKKVGELIVCLMERRLDGGYNVFAPEVDRVSRLHTPGGGLRQADVVARTFERPRGRALPKWDGGAKAAVRAPPPLPMAASAWGSIGGGLTHQHKQPWSCQVCTFLNEDPAFRSACEMCSTPRPSTIADLGAPDPKQDWDDDEQTGESASALPGGEGLGTAVPSGGAGLGPLDFTGTPRMQPATAGGEGYGGGVGGGVADGDGSDDDDGAVDGILGGFSPGGGASTAAAFATDVPTAAPYVAVRKGAVDGGGGDGGFAGGAGAGGAAGSGNAGIDWEQGEGWGGVGNATFGDDDSPVVGSPRHAAFGFPVGGGGGGGDDGVWDGGGGSEGAAP
eukprot:g11278.t2